MRTHVKTKIFGAVVAATLVIAHTPPAGATWTINVTRAQAAGFKYPGNDDTCWSNSYAALENDCATTLELDFVWPALQFNKQIYHTVRGYADSYYTTWCQLIGVSNYDNTTYYAGSNVGNTTTGNFTISDSSGSTTVPTAFSACWVIGPWNHVGNHNELYSFEWGYQ
jgi:hypothetical protein